MQTEPQQPVAGVIPVAAIVTVLLAAGCSAEPAPTAAPEQAVRVHLPDGPAAVDLLLLEEALIEAVREVGESDGNAIGPGEVVLYLYGPDADAILAAVRPALDGASLPVGSHAVVRRGPPGSAEESTILVD